MITKIKLIDDIEEEKEEEELFKIVKIKPISTSIETQLGIGAKAVGGATLPKLVEVPSSQYGISDVTTPEKLSGLEKGIIGAFGTWEAKKRAMPELQGMEDFGNEVFKQGDRRNQIAYIQEALTGTPKEETLKDMEANFEKFKDINPDIDERTWKEYYKEEGFWKTLITGPSKGKYDEAIKLRNQLIDIAQKVAEPGKDIIGQLGWSGMVVMMGTQAVNAIYKGGMVVENRVIKGEKLQQAVKRIQNAYIKETGKFKSSLSQNDFRLAQSLNQTLKQHGKDIFPLQSVQVPQEVFMGQAGKITNIVKLIQNAGKMTPEATSQLKALSPVEVSQITQQLLTTSPALASEFLKAVEKPEAPTEISKEVFKENISESESISEKQSIRKRTIEGVKSGELTGAVRFGSAAELEKTLKDKKLPISKEYDEIHAQPIIDKNDDYFAVYGPYNKHTVGIVIPKEYIQQKPDAHTKEVIVNPDVPVEKLKFIIKDKVYTYNEILETTGTREYVMPEAIVATGEGVGGTEGIPSKKPVIPKALEPLAEEAKKYESAEEFEKAVSDVMAKKNQFGGLSDKAFRAKLTKDEINLSNAHLEGKLGLHQLTDFYTQATAGKATTEQKAVVEPVAEKVAVPAKGGMKVEKPYSLNKELTSQQKIEGNVLMGQIHKVVNDKGLTKIEYTALKRKHGLSPHLATTTKRMTIPQLQAVLKAVNRARPKRVGYRRVVTLKTERKIQSLKTNLIDKLQMTEEAYQAVLKDVGVYKEPKYIDAKNFITETQGKDIIYRLIDEANILRIKMPYDKAVTENKAVKGEVDKLDRRIKSAGDRRLKDPHELNSMRLYIQKMETITGAPIYPLYQDLIDSHLENKQKLGQFIKGFEPYKEILKDEKELKKVNDYILAKSNLKDKPPIPDNITDKEIKLARKIEGILKDYEGKARTEKFLDSIDHPEDMPQYLEFKKEIDKAKDIYESKGYDDLVEYMKDQKWGVIKSGYSPLQVLTPKIRIYKPKPQTFGKGHIKVRTDIEYHEQDRSIIQRLFSYKKQMDNLVVMRPKVRALITLIDKNLGKFKDPPRISRNMEAFFRELKGYNRPENWFDRGLNRLYAQAMQTIIMPSPVLSGRNLLQNIAFGHDKTLLINPLNKKLTADEIDYFNTYISQMEAMRADWLMIGEKPLPGLATLTKIVRKIGIYPYSDLANRHWGYWAKINQVKRAFAKNVSLDKKMKAAKFSDMELTEQKMALQILAKDGEEAMARYVARVYVDNTQFLYDRSQRSPAEMGRVGRWAGNLMLFPRAYWEMLLKQTRKMTGKYIPGRERLRAFKVLASVIGGGILVGAAYKKVTGRRENPYDPLTLLAYEPGGLAIGTVEAVTDVYVNILMASKGDDRALAALTTAIPQAADMFIPFYAYTIRAFEASTDTKNIDRLALRKLRMMIDKEYKVRGGAYILEREAMEKWQYFLSGAGIDVAIKEREAEKKPIVIGKPSVSKITIPKISKIKITKISPIKSKF